MQLKCIKCGAPISEEQLLCSACGFQNDLELSKRFMAQEEEKEQLKKEQEKTEKASKEKEKLKKQTQEVYAQMKKIDTLGVLLSILFVCILLFALIGNVGEVISISNKAKQLFPDAIEKPFRDAFIRTNYANSWENQGLRWVAIFGISLWLAWPKLVVLFRTISASKKAKEINFAGKEWLLAVLEENKNNGITFDKFFSKKAIRDLSLIYSIVDSIHPELKVKSKIIVNSLVSSISNLIGGMIFGASLYNILILFLCGGPFPLALIISIILIVVISIASMCITLPLEKKNKEAVISTLNELSKESEEKAQ